jgi:hypothetical protein
LLKDGNASLGDVPFVPPHTLAGTVAVGSVTVVLTVTPTEASLQPPKQP